MMEPEDLQKALEAGNEVSTYLIIGDDQGQKRRALTVLQDHFCDPEHRDWNVEQVDGAEMDGLSLLDVVSTAPMLGGRRVIVVHQADQLSDGEELLPFVESPPDFSVLILMAPQIDKRRRLFTAVKKHGLVLEFSTVSGAGIAQRARSLAQQAGVELDREALDILVERLGDDGGKLDSEMEKLIAFAGDEGRVQGADARRLISTSDPALGQYAMFDFVDAISLGRGGEALERLHTLLAAGQVPLVILTMIARQFRILLGAYAWQGVDPASAAKQLGLKSAFPMRKAFSHVRHWTRDGIMEALEACSRCDLAMKAGVDGRRALETLTVTLAWKNRK